jgi:hypothetical protein
LKVKAQYKTSTFMNKYWLSSLSILTFWIFNCNGLINWGHITARGLYVQYQKPRMKSARWWSNIIAQIESVICGKYLRWSNWFTSKWYHNHEWHSVKNKRLLTVHWTSVDQLNVRVLSNTNLTVSLPYYDEKNNQSRTFLPDRV